MASSALDRHCGSPFWNSTLTWYAQDPEFTKCFEKTVLIWVPCLFLWLFAVFEIFYIFNSRNRNIPWNLINVSKFLITTLLILLTLADLIVAIKYINEDHPNVHNVDIFTPIIKIMTFSLAITFLIYNRRHGVRTSGLLFLFWLLLALCGIPQLRTEMLDFQKTQPDPYYFYVSYLTYYPLVLSILIINCFADKPPQIYTLPKATKPCPEEGSSFLCKIFYQWFDPMAWKGFRKPLKATSLWELQYENTANAAIKRFYKYWRKSLLGTSESSTSASYSRGIYKLNSMRFDFVAHTKKKRVSVLPALCKAFGSTFLFGAMLKFMQDVLLFVSPEILRMLISFVENDEPKWRGYLYVICLFGAATLQTLILSKYFECMSLVGMRIRTALMCAIYRKALRVSNSTRKEKTVGEIVNLMSVDAEKFIEMTAYVNLIWSAPLQIGLALYFLWNVLGPSVLAGLAVMLVLIPINGYVANRAEKLQVRQMAFKDHRVKLMNEILAGIKVLKLYAWETSFESQVLKIRKEELNILKQSTYFNACTSFIWSCAPYLVSLVSFGTYLLVDENHVLDATTAFVSLSLFNVIRFPLVVLPMMITDAIQTWVSVKRINAFMNSDELDFENVLHDSTEKLPVLIENGNFNWGKDLILKNINLQFRTGGLTAIVGSVGSGKSSLISAVLGEMDRISGRVNTLGSIAYVSQQAWIQNATLKDNITFGKSLEKKTYDKVVQACALKPDFDILPAGDQTEIGEKGINLSGGQKQRVSLARAVYSNADIYLLDDPLSAVDSHVGRHIFENVIGPTGLLRKTTRLLVTHGITYLPQVDNIVVLKDGEVSEVGTYQELMDKKGAFSEFLLQHLKEIDDSEDEEQISIDQLNEMSTTEINKKLTRLRLRESESDNEYEKTNDRFPLPSDIVLNGGLLNRQRSSSVQSMNKNRRDVMGEKLIEEEKTETGGVKWDVYKHYIKSIGVILSILAIVLSVVYQGFTVGSSMWLSVWSEETNFTSNSQLKYLGIYGALGFGQVVSSVISDLLPHLGCWYASRTMHNVLLKGILHAPLSFFDVTPSGRILSRFSNDVDKLDSHFPYYITDGIYCIVEVLGTLFVISYTTPIFIAVIVPIAVVYYLIQRYYIPTSRQLNRLEAVSKSPIYSHFGETITGAVAIRAFGVSDRFIKEFENKIDQNQRCHYPGIIANRWLAVRLETIGNFIILFAALFVVINSEQNPGFVGLSITYSLQITQTLSWLVRMTSDIETNIVAVERIKEYSECPQESSWVIANKTPPATWPERGNVVFKDFALRYRPGLELVLKNVSFSVSGGEKVGIVGRTGAGKSSLTLALFRIIEAAQGDIFIDGINIAYMGLHDLRSHLTIIPQDAVLFSGSLRLNLDPFENYNDQDVWKSLELANLLDFVKGLPAGLNHEVTEGGENLSVGQRQLICLSRALLRKTKVLILDEATAAIDLGTDDLIQKTIRTAFNDCTVLTIAHRLNTIMDSDKVIVLDKGYIVEFDSPGNLLQNKNSAFYSMAKDAGLV